MRRYSEKDLQAIFPKAKKIGSYKKIVDYLFARGARDRASAVRTSDIEDATRVSPSQYLDKMNARGVVEKSGNGGKFMVLAYSQPKFIHTRAQIKKAREETSASLLTHIQDDATLLLACVTALKLQGTPGALEIFEMVKHSADEDTDGDNLERYNDLIVSLKANGTTLSGCPTLEWRNGSNRWYLT